MNKESFPLHWPIGYKRSLTRTDSRFKQTMDGSQRFLQNELQRLRATDIVISTNIPLRRDGGMYADQMHRIHADPGVAVYFKYKNKEVVMCCDQYIRVWENVYALGKGIEALRGMSRWGVSEFMERAFTGFSAIEAAKEEQWYEVLEITPEANIEQIKMKYYRLCKEWHPDIKGVAGEQMMRKLNNAYEQAKNVKK